MSDFSTRPSHVARGRVMCQDYDPPLGSSTTVSTITAVAGLFCRGAKIIWHIVRILPSYFTVTCYPYKEIHVTAKGDSKIQTTCQPFWHPHKIVGPWQCISFNLYTWSRSTDHGRQIQPWQSMIGDIRTLAQYAFPIKFEQLGTTHLPLIADAPT